ncbi:AsnC family transcriptional regulator [Dielma fastidiosa]|uniref:AsnC family transcriptional regulator n=1 Tax=Dielma fastidiosa TaxID=1034346 RepID=UPI000E51B921|nr:AsnC family transcriptional regulator [Dielma fastidiosa]RHM96449.1 AsnC family transcriptional regulator [Dielma fastidiosa]
MPKYMIGSDEQQAYLNDYNWNVKGYSFFEPGVVSTDHKFYSAFNVAKSFYQIYPEVFNLPYIAAAVGLKQEDVKARLKKMYDNRQIMLVKNSCVGVLGFGLYYWIVKLKEGLGEEQRQEFVDWMQNNDQICTGYAMDAGGDFDFFNGNHMRNLDNLLGGVLDKFRFRDEVAYVHICPVRRLVRESHVNQFDAKENFRKYFWSAEQKQKLLALQTAMDSYDLAIIEAINNSESVADMFDYDVLAKLSGLDADEMKKDFVYLVEQTKSVIPMVYFNYRALGLKMHFYLVSMFQNTPTWRSEQICDELSLMPEFANIFDFADAHHNLMLSCYEEITDLDKIKAKLQSYGEIGEILEASSSRQLRRWTCRLDDENGLWEECVFTDDVLQDRTVNTGVICPACKEEK